MDMSGVEGGNRAIGEEMSKYIDQCSMLPAGNTGGELLSKMKNKARSPWAPSDALNSCFMI